jgi:hypothetical protein
VHDAAISDVERELLEVLLDGGWHFGMPLPQIALPQKSEQEIEESLRGLRSRGLIRSEWSHSVLDEQEYEGDWWIITDEGRAAIGLPPAKPEAFWMNPSSGPWRVSPLIAPLCAWRVRHGKEPVPRWYARLTGRSTA